MRQALAAAARDPRLGAALELQLSGKLAEAVQAYREILGARPRDANAAFLCGMTAMQAEAHAPAARLLTAAVQLDGGRADFHANLGLAKAQAGDLDGGIRPLTRAMLLAPEDAQSAFNLGQLLDRLGHRGQAFTALRASSHLQPGHAASWIEFGAVARLQGQPARANTALLMALKLDPEAPRAWFNIAMLRADQGINEDVEVGFRRAIELEPGYVEAVTNLGNHLRGQRRRAEARAVLEDGVHRDPMVARLWAGLSAVDFDDDRIAQARAAARRASVLDPGLVDGLANLAQGEHRDGSAGDAVRHGAAARILDPADNRVRFNLATYLLGDGQLAVGWRAYEARHEKTPDDALRGLPGPRWVEGAPPGRRLLVVAEQGLGDELLFATCLPDLQDRLAAGDLDGLAVEFDARLCPLLQRTFPGIEVFARLSTRATNDRPADYTVISAATGADCHVRAGSLPGLLRPDLPSFARQPLMLAPNPDRVAHWRAFLGDQTEAPVYGLTWRSMRQRDRGDVYYPPISSLAPLLTLGPAIRFVTLQYDDPEPDLQAIEDRHGIDIIRPPGIDLMNDLDDVAALITATRGVVSAYTAVLNLAGALNVPAFTGTYGYYWPTLGSGSLPWYPSVAIEMRTAGDSWDAVMHRLAKRLRDHLTA
jgi:tetratricopeptide (TPR) repeat protein